LGGRLDADLKVRSTRTHLLGNRLESVLVHRHDQKRFRTSVNQFLTG